MRTPITIILFIIFFQPVVFGAELVLSGVYQGKDVYVQNPFLPKENSFCTESVFVNGEEVISNPGSSGFRIKLGHLTVNAEVVIRIIHKEGCSPRIVNADVIKPVSNFAFISATANRNAISWLAKGELPGGNFFIERKKVNEGWEEVKNIPGKGGIISGNYQIPVTHENGENIYRIRFEGPDSKRNYSDTFSYEFEDEPITFYPSKVTARISLSRKADYLITDKEGNRYLEGKNDIINVVNLPEGEYILHIQDRKEPFIKEKVKRPPRKKRKKDNS